MLKPYLFIVPLFLTFATSASGAHIKVATASNFLAPLKKLSKVYEEKTGHQISIISGSTGKLYAQIKQGAPYDVFLAADSLRPQILEHEKAIVPKSRFTYAQGQLAVWSKGASLNNRSSLELLCSQNFQFVAMANPKLAPYGRASLESLKSLSCWHDFNAQVVTAENIGQTYQFVATGAAEIGFVAFSQLKGKAPKDQYYIISTQLHQPIIQQGVILKDTKAPEVADDFRSFLLSSAAQATLAQYGYIADEL